MKMLLWKSLLPFISRRSAPFTQKRSRGWPWTTLSWSWFASWPPKSQTLWSKRCCCRRKWRRWCRKIFATFSTEHIRNVSRSRLTIAPQFLTSSLIQSSKILPRTWLRLPYSSRRRSLKRWTRRCRCRPCLRFSGTRRCPASTWSTRRPIAEIKSPCSRGAPGKASRSRARPSSARSRRTAACAARSTWRRPTTSSRTRSTRGPELYKTFFLAGNEMIHSVTLVKCETWCGGTTWGISQQNFCVNFIAA